MARVLSTLPRDGDFNLVQAGEWDEREKPFAMMCRRDVQDRIVLYAWYCYSTAQTSLTSNLL